MEKLFISAICLEVFFAACEQPDNNLSCAHPLIVDTSFGDTIARNSTVVEPCGIFPLSKARNR